MKPAIGLRKATVAAVILLLLLSGCDDKTKQIVEDIFGKFATGWLSSNENLGQIESDVNPAAVVPDKALPAKVDLSARFPPIGDQGQYGTCVAWAVGYNLRTYIHAVDNNLSATQLASTTNQFSPKDLYWSIPSDKKGTDCNGTNFEPALDMLLSRGVATLNTVPYQNLSGCGSAPDAAWTSEAANYKIRNYRKIALDATSVKTYLSQGRAVVIGAKLGQNFMNWNNDDVLTSDFAGNVGQHAYHAMIISGYDDSKGPRGAFRVVNTWSTNWGDGGHIWVDYDFFTKDFAFCAFVGNGKVENPDQNGDNQVDNVEAGTTDLVAWELTDSVDKTDASGLARTIVYNVFNAGDQLIPASKDWKIVYIYYDAYNAANWGVLLYDFYTDNYGTAGQNAHLDSGGMGQSDNWWNHVDVPAGKSVAQAVYSSTTDARFTWGYTLPDTLKDGQYYLALIADGFDDIKEKDEDNNYFFATAADGGPLTVTGRVIQGNFGKNGSSPLGFLQDRRPARFAPSPAPTAVTPANLNAYTPQEIRRMIKIHKKSGALAQKIQAFQNAQKNRRKTSVRADY